MTEFDAMLQRNWARHQDAPEEVALQLRAHDTTAFSATEFDSYLKLLFHVENTHLDRPETLREFLTNTVDAGLKGGSADPLRTILSRYLLLIDICSTPSEAIPLLLSRCEPLNLDSLDRSALFAMAASELCHGSYEPRSGEFFRLALLEYERNEDQQSPAVRAIAVAANNLAVQLEAMAEQSQEAKELMVFSALKAREFWGICGSAVNIERAEYRLAKCYLKAKMLQDALAHARLCEQICLQENLPGAEKFYASALLAEVHKERYLEVYANLSPDDQKVCILP